MPPPAPCGHVRRRAVDGPGQSARTSPFDLGTPGDVDGRPGLPQPQRDTPPDAPARAGDDGNFAPECCHMQGYPIEGH